MLSRRSPLRARLADDAGFTLVELLVVILIIGILAAIAIPSFLNQKGKGEDAAAKSAARQAVTALETFYLDNGSFSSVDGTKLRAIEPTLPQDGTAAGQMELTNIGSTSYTVTIHSKPSNRTFSVTKSSGVLSRSCNVNGAPDKGGCPNGSW